MKLFTRCILVFLCVSIANAGAAENQPQPVKRHILALYDSTEVKTAKETLIHAHAEVILNHLGFILDYYDINEGLPPAGTMDKYRGILTWFQDNRIKNATAYNRWIQDQIKAGKKAVILDNFGAFQDNTGDPVDPELIEATFRLFGVDYLADETHNPLIITVTKKDSSMVEFERKLTYEIRYYIHLKPVDPALKIYLSLERTDIPDSESAIVFTSPVGGMAIETYVFYLNLSDYATQWRINPFAFFSQAFGMKSIPVPDITTYYGNRLLFTHIDGDGFVSQSRIGQSKLCGEIIIEEILKKYAIPTSASIIVGEFITKCGQTLINQNNPAIRAVRSMYAIPYIEPASHGYTHPLHWEKKITALAFAPYSSPITSLRDKILKDTRYGMLTMSLAYIEKSYQEMIKTEILDSLEFINKNLIPDQSKKASLFFWTGNCIPHQDALLVCKKSGIRTINGGDPIFDDTNNSYTYLCPIKRPEGDQYYTAACNENIYSNLWSGPFYGYKYVINTFKNTESPVRIKPANIYYHYYSGERAVSLNALKTVYDFVLEEKYFPVNVSTYIDIAGDWFLTEISVLKENCGFLIKNTGKCRTVRIDNCSLYPDFSKCYGIVGFIHYQNSLYIHLDGTGESVLWLTAQMPQKVFVHKSTGEITGWSAYNQRVSFKVTGTGALYITLANLSPESSYICEYENAHIPVSTDKSGTATIVLPATPVIKNSVPVTLTIDR